MSDQKIWRIIERLNFNKDKAAWDEHRIITGLTFNEAHKFVTTNKNRILYAYLPSFGGMAGIIYNPKYIRSLNIEKRFVKQIDWNENT